MKYLSVYIFLGLLLLAYSVFGLHKKSLYTNKQITSLLQTKTHKNKENQLRCSIETPTTQRMLDIPRKNPHGGIGQPVSGQPPSNFYAFDPNNRDPEETKLFNNDSNTRFSQSYHSNTMNNGTKDFSFSNPTKCFDCEKQVKSCRR